MKSFFRLVVLLSLTTQVQATDLGFRYTDGKCLNAKGEMGLNPNFFGQCSDLTGVVLGKFDFTGSDFSGSSFKASDLRSSNFTNAQIVGANFEGANLSGVVLNGANLERSNFKDAVLNKTVAGDANFKLARLDGASFTGANLSYAILDQVSAVGANFQSADLTESVWSNATLTQAHFDKATIKSVKMKTIKAEMSTWSEAVIQDTRIEGFIAPQADFQSAVLIRVMLAGAQINKATANGARFEMCNLSGVQWNESKLASSEFLNSDLTSADLSKTNIRRVNFTGSTIEGVLWMNAEFTKGTLFKYTKDEAIALGMKFVKADRISLFFNGKYVDVVDTQDGEAMNLKKRIQKIGEVQTYDSVAMADTLKILDDSSLVIIPEMEKGSLAVDLPQAVADEYKKYVSAGGTMAFHATPNNLKALIKKIFGTDINEVDATSPLTVDMKKVETSVFKGFAQATLPELNATFCLNALPEGAVAIARNGKACNVLVTVKYGAGQWIYFGYDGYDFAPTGSQDGGWGTVFDLAIKAHMY